MAKTAKNIQIKNNLPIIIAIIGIVIIILGIFWLKSSFSSVGVEENGPGATQVENMKTVNEKIKERKAQGKLDIGLFDDPKFTALRVYEIEKFDIGNLNVGKENPFEK